MVDVGKAGASPGPPAPPLPHQPCVNGLLASHPRASFLPLFEMQSQGEVMALEVPGLGSGGLNNLEFSSQGKAPQALNWARRQRTRSITPIPTVRLGGDRGRDIQSTHPVPTAAGQCCRAVCPNNVGGKPVAF